MLPIDQTYLGLYAQDAWSATSPRDGQRGHPMGAVLRAERPHRARCRTSASRTSSKGVKSTVFRNAPAGLLYPGDAGFPDSSKSGAEQAVVEPVAACRRCLGRARRRTPGGADVLRARPTTSSAASTTSSMRARRRLPTGCASRACRSTIRTSNTPGGNPFPIPPPVAWRARIRRSAPTARSIPTSIPRACRTGTSRSSGRSAPHGRRRRAISAAIRIACGIWSRSTPGGIWAPGPARSPASSYPVCTTAANLDQRRVLYAQNPAEARFLGPVDRHTEHRHAGLSRA